ncbi:MAG TPA: ABC transporter substrate-binding protein [Gaiellales bacterium]|jgi:peptide/nickel transport system substrate-binding protein
MRNRTARAAALTALLAVTGLAVAGSGTSIASSSAAGGARAGTTASGAVLPYQPAHRGGTLTMLWTGVGSSIDPGIDYDGNWQLLVMDYDGLMAWKRVAGADGNTLVPDLAQSIPTPTNGGKQYAFKLRPGILFSNGQKLVASDVKTTVLRQFKIPGPVPSYYQAIIGGDACAKTPKTCNLDRGIIVNDAAGTVTFKLSRPDPDFLQKLAEPFAYVVPKDAPLKDSGTKALPGTGPYMISRYTPNQEIDFVRNPHFKEWSRAAQPAGYPDKMVLKIGLTTEDETTEVLNGQADWMQDEPPADRLQDVASKAPKQIFLHPTPQMYHMALNVRVPPFNSLKVRQALNYATDRKAIQTIWGGPKLAVITCQVLPPNFPGYKPYCPYTRNPGTTWTAPDMAKAQQLVNASGTKGQKVTLILTSDSQTKAIGAYYVSLLDQLGYKAGTKILTSAVQYPYVQDSRNKAQISFSYWRPDYEAPSNFLDLAFGCTGFHANSTASPNLPEFCDPSIQAKITKALATQLTNVNAANVQWAAIDKLVTDAAPLIPLFVQNRLDFVSKRVGNFQASPSVVGDFMIDQAWVK